MAGETPKSIRGRLDDLDARKQEFAVSEDGARRWIELREVLTAELMIAEGAIAPSVGQQGSA